MDFEAWRRGHVRCALGQYAASSGGWVGAALLLWRSIISRHLTSSCARRTSSRTLRPVHLSVHSFNPLLVLHRLLPLPSWPAAPAELSLEFPIVRLPTSCTCTAVTPSPLTHPPPSRPLSSTNADFPCPVILFLCPPRLGLLNSLSRRRPRPTKPSITCHFTRPIYSPCTRRAGRLPLFFHDRIGAHRSDADVETTTPTLPTPTSHLILALHLS